METPQPVQFQLSPIQDDSDKPDNISQTTQIDVNTDPVQTFVDLNKLYPGPIDLQAGHPGTFFYKTDSGYVKYTMSSAFLDVGNQLVAPYERVTVAGPPETVSGTNNIFCIKVENVGTAKKAVSGTLPCLALGEDAGPGFLVWMGVFNNPVVTQTLDDGTTFSSPAMTTFAAPAAPAAPST